MSGQKTLFIVALSLILAGLGWYLWTQTDLLSAFKINNQAEELAYERCVNIAKREYEITSTEGDNDFQKTALRIRDEKLKACDEEYGR